MRILAIDPGTTDSAYVLVGETCRPLAFGKVPNAELLADLAGLAANADHVAIEQIGHYGTGMPAGREVFDTCRWIGRFEQVLHDAGVTSEFVLRATIKTHICGTAKAGDSNITQALIDRFAPGVRNRGKGTKAAPGFFYGFKSDIWQAFALAVYIADCHSGRPGVAG